jgi:hypothetical protein
MERFRTRGMEVVHCDSDRLTSYAEVIPETRTHDYFRLAEHSLETSFVTSSNPVSGQHPGNRTHQQKANVEKDILVN